MEHLNSGNGSIIPEIQDLKCSIRFVPEFLDTEGDAKAAVKQLIGLMNRPTLQPCAFLGAFLSEVSIPSAIITGLEGFPQVTALSKDPQLGDKEKYPLFGSVASQDNARPLLEYILREWNVENLAVLHETNDQALAYWNNLQLEARAFPSLRLQSVGFQENDMGDKLSSKIALLKDTQMRFFFVMSRADFSERILQEAYVQGIAGTGEHNWIFTDETVTLLAPTEFEASAPIFKAATGLFVYRQPGSRQGVGAYDKFLSAWTAIGESSDGLAFLEAKLPSHSDAPAYSTAMGAEVFAELHPLVPPCYDATVLLGLSACAAQEETLEGARHFEKLLGTAFVGASGPIELDPHTGLRKTSKSIFLLENFVPELTSNGNDQLVKRELALYHEGKWNTSSTSFPIFNDNTSNFPVDLPPLTLEKNYIGQKLRRFGYSLFSVVFLAALAMASWTFWNRRSRVIRASQPMFLYCICFGVTVMGASLIPMGLDDEILADPSAACFGYPVLLTIGWSFAMSSLLSKTRVVKKIFRKPSFRRVVLKRSDILKPMVVLLLVNMLVLVVWVAVSPYTWTRNNVPEDSFQRPKVSLGQCESEHQVYFWTSFSVINLGVLLFASQQAFVARKIAIEFAESEFISMAISSTLITSFVACPVMIMVADDPRAFYFVQSAFVFVVSMSLLLFLFLPKIIYFRRNGNKNYEVAVKTTLERLNNGDQQHPNVDNHAEEVIDDTIGAWVVDHPKLRPVYEQKFEELCARNEVLEQRLAEYESVETTVKGEY